MLSPEIDSLAQQFAGRVKIGKVNVADEENEPLALTYQVSSLPTILFFQGGDKPVHRLVGYYNRDALARELDRLLSN